MKQHPDIKEIEPFIQKIGSDELFCSSIQLVELLRLLIEESLNGNQLKEMTLGIKFFGERYAEKDNGSARVYVYNLRKKLNAYYADRGAGDSLKFILEKGSYKIRFERETHDVVRMTPRIKRLAMCGVSLIALLVAVLWLFMPSLNEDYCWGKFLKNGANNTCVLADHITINHWVNSVKCTLSHPRITNETVVNREIADSVNLTQFTYFSKDVPYSLYQLTKWFAQNDSDIILTPESELNYAETKHSNIIYMGHYKTMGVSKQIFDKYNTSYKIENNTIVVERDGNRKIYNAKFKSNYVKAYAIVSYFALNEQHEALYFVSNSDVGTMAAVSYFTNRESLKELYRTVPKDRYFNLLLEVEGVGRTNASCRLVDVDLLGEIR